MAAHFAPPLPCILLALEQSETHVNGDPECQPATSLLASNNTASMNALASAHERAPRGFKPFKTREQASSTQKQREAEGKKAKTQRPGSTFKDKLSVHSRQRCAEFQQQ